MTLDLQLHDLITEAANHQIAPIVIKQAIVPVFEPIAQQLQHLDFYLLRNTQDDWIISVLSKNPQNNNPQSDRLRDKSAKKVIYAFSSLKDAQNFPTTKAQDLLAVQMPVIQILFQFFIIQQLDSLIFFDQQGNLKQGLEVDQADLRNQIQSRILQLNSLPPDIA